MPLAVTHVLLTIILVDLYRDYLAPHKHYFTLHTILIAGVAGLLPDIDIPINWIMHALGVSIQWLSHGGITHTPLFGFLFLIPGIYLWKKEQHQNAMYFFVITFGICFHLFLDALLGGGSSDGIMFFFPFSTIGFKLHLLKEVGLKQLPAALDAVILLAWLWHEEKKHKITDFF